MIVNNHISFGRYSNTNTSALVLDLYEIPMESILKAKHQLSKFKPPLKLYLKNAQCLPVVNVWQTTI